MTPFPARTIRKIVALGFVFLSSFTVSVTLAVQPPGSPTTRFLFTRDFEAWRYVATEQQDEIVLAVELPSAGRAALKSYIQANELLAPELFAQQELVQATVVFKRALPLDRLPILIMEAYEQVEEFSLRVRGGQQERITVFGVPGDDQLIEPEPLARILKEIEEKTGRTDLQGVTNVTLILNASQYQALISSSEVRFVDIIPAAARADYERNPAPDATATHINVISAAIYWYHENLDDEQLSATLP